MKPTCIKFVIFIILFPAIAFAQTAVPICVQDGVPGSGRALKAAAASGVQGPKTPERKESKSDGSPAGPYTDKRADRETVTPDGGVEYPVTGGVRVSDDGTGAKSSTPDGPVTLIRESNKGANGDVKIIIELPGFGPITKTGKGGAPGWCNDPKSVCKQDLDCGNNERCVATKGYEECVCVPLPTPTPTPSPTPITPRKATPTPTPSPDSPRLRSNIEDQYALLDEINMLLATELSSPDHALRISSTGQPSSSSGTLGDNCQWDVISPGYPYNAFAICDDSYIGFLPDGTRLVFEIDPLKQSGTTATSYYRLFRVIGANDDITELEYTSLGTVHRITKDYYRHEFQNTGQRITRKTYVNSDVQLNGTWQDVGQDVVWEYDSANRLKRVIHAPTEYIDRAALGALHDLNQKFVESFEEEFRYGLSGELQEIKIKRGSRIDEIVESIRWRPDSKGIPGKREVASITDEARGLTFSFTYGNNSVTRVGGGRSVEYRFDSQQRIVHVIATNTHSIPGEVPWSVQEEEAMIQYADQSPCDREKIRIDYFEVGSNGREQVSWWAADVWDSYTGKKLLQRVPTVNGELITNFEYESFLNGSHLIRTYDNTGRELLTQNLFRDRSGFTVIGTQDPGKKLHRQKQTVNDVELADGTTQTVSYENFYTSSGLLDRHIGEDGNITEYGYDARELLERVSHGEPSPAGSGYSPNRTLQTFRETRIERENLLGAPTAFIQTNITPSVDSRIEYEYDSANRAKIIRSGANTTHERITKNYYGWLGVAVAEEYSNHDSTGQRPGNGVGRSFIRSMDVKYDKAIRPVERFVDVGNPELAANTKDQVAQFEYLYHPVTGLLWKKYGALGEGKVVEYDGLNRLRSIAIEGGSTLKKYWYAPHEKKVLTLLKDDDYSETTYRMSPLSGSLIQTDYSNGQSVKLQYTDREQVAVTARFKGNSPVAVRSYSHDKLGRTYESRFYNPLNLGESHILRRVLFNERSQPVQITSISGDTITFAYDSIGRLISDSYQGRTISRKYFPNSDLLKKLSLQIGANTPEYHQEFQYNIFGEVNNRQYYSGDKLTTAALREVQLRHGSLGVDKIVHADGRVSEMLPGLDGFNWRNTPDAIGTPGATLLFGRSINREDKKISYQRLDPHGRATKEVFGLAGVLEQSLPAQPTTFFEYNNALKLEKVTRADGSEARIHRNADFGRVSSIEYLPPGGKPLGKITKLFTYDPIHGRVQSVSIQERGATQATNFFEYDQYGRRVSDSFSSERGISRVRWGFIDENGNNDFSGQVHTISTGITGEVTRRYKFDQSTRLMTEISIENPTGNLPGIVAAFGYDGTRPESIVLANGIHSTIAYDEEGRLLGVSTARNTTPVDGYQILERDSSERITEKQLFPRTADGVVAESYRYNSLGQLTGVNELTDLTELGAPFLNQEAFRKWRFSYETNSGLLSSIQEIKGNTIRNRGMQYDLSSGALSSIEQNQITHDQRLRTDDDEFSDRQYRYDLLGRLRSVEDSNGEPLATLHYDALGRLVEVEPAPGKALPTSRSGLIQWFHWQRVGEGDGAGNPSQLYMHYPYASDELLGMIDISSGEARYVSSSHDSTPSAVYDGRGTRLEQPHYAPFGEEILGSKELDIGADGHIQLGHKAQGLSGLAYLRNRILDTREGRFLTPDPYGGVLPEELAASHSFSANDPVNKKDPMGLQPRMLNMMSRWWSGDRRPLEQIPVDLVTESLSQLGERRLEDYADLKDGVIEVVVSFGEDPFGTVGAVAYGATIGMALEIYNDPAGFASDSANELLSFGPLTLIAGRLKRLRVSPLGSQTADAAQLRLPLEEPGYGPLTLRESLCNTCKDPVFGPESGMVLIPGGRAGGSPIRINNVTARGRFELPSAQEMGVPDPTSYIDLDITIDYTNTKMPVGDNTSQLRLYGPLVLEPSGYELEIVVDGSATGVLGNSIKNGLGPQEIKEIAREALSQLFRDPDLSNCIDKQQRSAVIMGRREWEDLPDPLGSGNIIPGRPFRFRVGF